MPRKLTLDQIAARNPGVNPTKVAGWRTMVDRLKSLGAVEANYDLVPPFSGRRPVTPASKARKTAADARPD